MKSINKIGIIVLLLLFLVPLSVLAQKTKKVEIGKLYRIQLPSSPLPKDYKTYKVVTSTSTEYRADKIVNSIKIDGFEKVMDEKVDFKVKIKEYEMLFTDSERKRVEHTRKVDGVEKKYYTYKYSFRVIHKLKVDIHNNNGELLLSEEISNLKIKISSDESESTETALKNFKKRKNELRSTLLTGKLKTANSYLNNKIGFPKVDIYVTLHTGKTKRKSKFNYDDYDEAIEFAKEGVNILIQDENDIQPAKEHFDKAFEIWNVALEESDLEDKKARVNKKVTAMTYYNMMICNFLLKENDRALEDIKKIEDTAKKFYVSQIMKKRILDTKKRVEANK